MLLTRMDPDDSDPVRRLLKHSPDTAGGLMTSDPVVLTPATSVADALARVRDPDLTAALSSMVFVALPPTATPTGRYLGCVPLQRLLRVPPADLVAAPTPPPEIEVEVWLESIQMLRSLEPKRICMTHFGDNDPETQLARVEAWLKDAAEESSHDDRERFAEWLLPRFDAEDGDVAERLKQAMPPDQLWLGLERYWRKRRESESEDSA